MRNSMDVFDTVQNRQNSVQCRLKLQLSRIILQNAANPALSGHEYSRLWCAV